MTGRPRIDARAARVTICVRVAAETQRRIAAHRVRTGEGLGQIIDRVFDEIQMARKDHSG
jgi:hypothetical protein